MSLTLRHAIYFATVFFTGAAVLVVEITAVRLLTPLFGGSLYVLSSVLSVVLLALSLGYFFGGRLADRFPIPLPLYMIIASGGLSILLLYYLAATSIDPSQTHLSLISGPIIYSLLLFFMPAFLLGMDSPYVIKLISTHIQDEDTGAYVGTTFFWSTIGSICGSIATGFWLVPTLGVYTTIMYTGFGLVIIGLCTPLLLQPDIFAWKKTNLPYVSFALAALILAITLIVSGGRNVFLPDNTLVWYSGLYTDIRVEEMKSPTQTIRTLRRDTNFSSAIYLENYNHVFAYTQFSDLHSHLVPTAEAFLVLGGGAYTAPRRLVALEPDITVDVVEIEPSLYALAQTYFDLTDTSRITNHVSDARTFLQTSTSSFDFIFMDTFGSALDIPFHLATHESIQLLEDRLNPHGAVVINSVGVIHDGDANFTAGLYKTLLTVFDHVLVFQALPDRLDTVQNIMFVAHNTATTTSLANAVIDLPDHQGTTTLGTLAVDTSTLLTSPTPAFTDNHAPVEYLLAQQMRRFRSHR